MILTRGNRSIRRLSLGGPPFPSRTRTSLHVGIRVSTTRRRHAYGAARGLVAGGDRRPHPPQAFHARQLASWLIAAVHDARTPDGDARAPRERARFVARVMRILFSVTKRKETQTIRGQTVVCAAVTDERLRTRHVAAPLGSVLRSRRASSSRFISCAPAPHGSNHALTTVDGRACSMQHA